MIFMSFGKMVELLQQKDKGKIVLVNTGSFYIARGKDAVLLNKLLGLKVTCMETEVCKVGFPITSLEKYLKLIKEKEYSYIVYNFDNTNAKLSVIREYKGIKLNKVKEDKLNCYVCSNTVKMYKKHDKYIQAIADLYEEEKREKENVRNQLNNKKEEKNLWYKINQKKKKTN